MSTDRRNNDTAEVLPDEALDRVVGGLNPQPLPPAEHPLFRGPSCPGYR